MNDITRHLNCYNYYAGDNPLIIKVIHRKGENIVYTAKTNLITFILKGSMKFSYGLFVNIDAGKGSIVILPAGLESHAHIYDEDTTFLSFQLKNDGTFCEHFSYNLVPQIIEKEMKNIEIKNPELHILKTTEQMDYFLQGVINYMDKGLSCRYLFEMKIKELMYLLRLSYSRKDLFDLFAPIMNSDLLFSLKIHSLYSHSVTVMELAEAMHYSLSGFEKKFKRIFNFSVNQWLQNQKAQSVYHDITCTTKTFSELAYEYDFSSSAHFNSFCKKMFKNSPKTIRESVKKL